MARLWRSALKPVEPGLPLRRGGCECAAVVRFARRDRLDLHVSGADGPLVGHGEASENESLHAQRRARDAEATNSPPKRRLPSLMCLLRGFQMALSPVSSIQRIERSCHVDVEAAIARHLRCEAISAIVTGLPAE